MEELFFVCLDEDWCYVAGYLIIRLGGWNPSLLAFSSLLEDIVRRIKGVFTSGNTLGFIWGVRIKKFTRVWGADLKLVIAIVPHEQYFATVGMNSILLQYGMNSVGIKFTCFSGWLEVWRAADYFCKILGPLIPSFFCQILILCIIIVEYKSE